MIVGMLAGWLRSEHRPPQQPSRAVAVYAGGSARALIKPRRVMDAQPKLSEAVVQQLVALPAGCGRMWRSGIVAPVPQQQQRGFPNQNVGLRTSCVCHASIDCPLYCNCVVLASCRHDDQT
jgi:hypothetical protein